MRPRFRWFLIPVAGIAITAATCQPTKPIDVKPDVPGVNPCDAETVAINEDECEWLFQRDQSTSTTQDFTTEAFSIGAGSVKGGPIGPTLSDKFIAEYFADLPVADLQSIAYDFLIDGDGKTEADKVHFYLNVYTTFTDPEKFYDCRFDYIPTDGSTTNFTEKLVTAAENADNAREGSGVTPDSCPENLAGMPPGSHVRAIALNIGDGSANDVDLAGFLDNVRIATADGTKTFDFEAD